MSKTQAPDPAQAPRPFIAVKAFADSVLAMLDERIKTADRGTHPFNDYFGDKPEAIVAAKAQASELREVRTQARMLADRALVDLMKFKPAIPSPEGAQPLNETQIERAWRLGFRHACDAERLNSDEEWGYKRANVIEEVQALAAPALQATDAELERRTGEPHVDGWPLVSGLPVPQAPAWQPIETAPKDGTAILLGSRGGAWIGKWLPVYVSGYRPDNPWSSLMLNHDHMGEKWCKPTHWMPLPAAPQTKELTNDR